MATEFIVQLNNSVPAILEAIEANLPFVEKYQADHICWRTETRQEYDELISSLKDYAGATLLIESIIGGRLIATFELHNGIICCSDRRNVTVLEIPSPKEGSPYKRGLEHVEFVIGDSNDTSPMNSTIHQTKLQTFMEEHPEIKWNTKAMNKEVNPDVSCKVKLEEFGMCSVKFHLMPLSKVIEYEIASESKMPPSAPSNGEQSHHRPILFLDIDGVLNTTKHAPQIHFSVTHLHRLKRILESTQALIVLTTFWRHFHEYITYVLHRHGIDVECVLPLPVGATRGKQCTKNFLRHHSIRQQSSGVGDKSGEDGVNSMFGRSAEDEGEYSSRAEEIEAWLRMYGEQYLGSYDKTTLCDDEKLNGCNNESNDEKNNNYEGYEFHPAHWKYAILDDRPSAAKQGTPLFDRFVFTQTKLGLTHEDVEKVTELLLHGPKSSR